VGINTGGHAMVEFETMKAEEIKFGKNNFLEIARKKAIVEEGGNNEFISISRGFFRTDGSKTFKKSIAIPDDESIKKFLATHVTKI
jgi:hypothetical protein